MASEGAQLPDIAGAMIESTAVADWLVVTPVALPLLAGALLVMLRRQLAMQAWIANFVLFANLIACGALAWRVAVEGPLAMTMGRWLPPFGISFAADLTGVILTATAALVALACGIYATSDIDGTRSRYGFYPFFLLMIAGVNGAFLTGDVFNLYVWFEVLLIASFGLIVLGSEPAQLDGALKYAFLNLVATTLFLIATGYVYGTFGTLNMADLTVKIAEAPDNAPVTTIAALYLMAFAMKAAAFPLNFWLPASYHTPRIVVSAVFAGLLTKVGVYALLRIVVMLFAGERGQFAEWIAWIAFATMILGVMGALAQNDIRRLIAFLVISGIGAMLAGAALAGPHALPGAIVYAAHSMIVMAGLFLAAGVVGKRAGTFDLRALGGFYAASPWFAACFLIFCFSVAGLPPLSGFWPKVMLVKGALLPGAWWLAAAILVSALLTSMAAIRVWLFAFWRGGPEGTRDGAEAWKIEPYSGGSRLASGASIAILLVATVLLGVFPETLIRLSGEAAAGLTSPQGYVDAVFGGPQ